MLELYKKSRAVLSAFLGLTVAAAGVGLAPAAYAADSDVSVVVQELSSDRGLQVVDESPEVSSGDLETGTLGDSEVSSGDFEVSSSDFEPSPVSSEPDVSNSGNSEEPGDTKPAKVDPAEISDALRDTYVEYRDTGDLVRGAGNFVDYDPAKGIPEIRDEGVFLWTLYRDIVSGTGAVQTTSPVAKIIIRNDYTAPLVYVLKSENYLRLVSTDMLSGVDKLQIDDRILKYRDDTVTWNSINGKNKSWTLVSVEGGTVSEREAAKVDGVPAGAIGLIFTFQKTANHPVKVSDVATNLTHFTVSIDGTGGDEPEPIPPPPDSGDSSSGGNGGGDSGNGGSDISGSADPRPDDSKDDGWPDPGSSDSDNSGGSNNNSGGSGDNSGGSGGNSGGTQEFPGFSAEVTIKDSGTITVDPDGNYHASGGDNNWKGYRPKDDDDDNGDNSNDRDPSTNGDIDWPGDQGSGGNGNGSGNGDGNGSGNGTGNGSGNGAGDGSGNGSGNGTGNGDGWGDGDLISGWNTPGDPDYIIDTGNSNGNANGGNSGGAMGDIGGALNGNVQTGNAGGHHVSCRSLDCDGSCLQRHLYRCIDADCMGTCKMLAALDIIATVLGLIAILGLMFLTAIGKIRVPAVVFIVVSIVWGLASAAGALALFRYSREIALACVCGMLLAIILSILLTFKNRSKGPKSKNHSNSRKQSDYDSDKDSALDVEYFESKGGSSTSSLGNSNNHDEYDWNDSED